MKNSRSARYSWRLSTPEELRSSSEASAQQASDSETRRRVAGHRDTIYPFLQAARRPGGLHDSAALSRLS